MERGGVNQGDYLETSHNYILKNNILKIGYFADGPWAHKTFEKLIADKSIKICFVCVRYDRNDEILKKLAFDNNIDVLVEKNINSQDFIELTKNKYDVDLFVSMSFNQIFKNKIINLPRLKTINCHAGKLPFYRGRNILNWALINDEKEFGITVHYVDEGIDTGDIILQRTFQILDSDDYNTLLEKAYEECANILYDAIVLIRLNLVKPIKQKNIHSFGMYCGRRQAGDEIIDWNQNSRDLFNFIRAICKPGPMAQSYINNKVIYINKSEMVKDAINYKCIVGQVLSKDKDNSFYVKTKDNVLKITQYFYDGIIKVGDRLK